MSAHVNLKKVLCPWCRESIAGSTDLKACATCSSIMHNTCYAELGGGNCATCLIEKIGGFEIPIADNRSIASKFFSWVAKIIELCIHYSFISAILYWFCRSVQWLILNTIFSIPGMQLCTTVVLLLFFLVFIIYLEIVSANFFFELVTPFKDGWLKFWNKVLGNKIE